MKPYLELVRHNGNKTLFNLVEMSIISTFCGNPFHLHAEGLRGTGKTSIMRAAQQIMPKIQRIKGCIYNCDPDNPHCPEHRHLRPEEIREIGTEFINMPFLEISHSAKIGTVTGSIDLAKLTNPEQPQAALLPGIIPQAHRGIVFIDEINRLADTSPEITDILLDVMGNKPGRLQIEEAGLPVVEIPSMVSVWAASNPDEDPGPLEEVRRQLSDRFDLVYYMGRPDSVELIAQILQKEKSTVNHAMESKIAQYRNELEKKAECYNNTSLPDFLYNFIARIYIKHNIESLRGIEAMQQGAVLNSILKCHEQVTINDVLEMIPLSLKHRVNGDNLVKIMNSLDTHSSKKGIINIPATLPKLKRNKRNAESDYFPQTAQSIKNIERNQLVSTEQKLNSDTYL